MQKQLLDWRYYKLGEYPYPDSEEEVGDDKVPEVAVMPPPPPQLSTGEHQLGEID